MATQDSAGVEPDLHLQLPRMAVFLCLALAAVKFVETFPSYPVTDLSQSALNDCSNTITGKSQLQLLQYDPAY